MQKKLIFLLAFMVLIAVFALQNSMEVSIKLWFWSVQTSMVLILILTFAAGAIAGILFSIPKKVKKPEKDMDKPAEPALPSDDQVLSENEPPSDDDEFEDVGRNRS